jgi:hypothetical protein
MSNTEKISLEKILAELSVVITRRDYAASRDMLIRVLCDIRNELSSRRALYEESELNQIYATGIFLRGILDYVNIRKIVSNSNWTQNHRLIDLVWTRMWDCKDRIESYPNVLAGSFIEQVRKFIDFLFLFFRENFGEGVYMSPEIKVRRAECTICNDNIKKCSHIPGRLYGGQMCRQKFVDMEALGASIVSHPEDYRCRIWPWNFNKKESTFTVPVLTMFLIDDFIQDERWPEPDIQWPEGLRPASSEESANEGPIP